VRSVEPDEMRGFVLGVVVTVVVALVAGFTVVNFGLLSSAADRKPSHLERWAANRSLAATIARETAGLTDPLPATDDNLTAGVKLYAANCVFCHGAADAKRSTASAGLYIHAPQLADDGVEDDPEPVTYWKIAHGIRFTAMPAFGKTLTGMQIWQLAQFLAKMDKLPPAVEAQWKTVPSVGSP
jgi:mono/diheme cytochrome c family protein